MTHTFIDKNKIEFLDSRWYKCDDVPKEYVPSVTTINKAFYGGEELAQWLKSTGEQADEILKQAGEQGTKVHNATELFHTQGTVLTVEQAQSLTMMEVAMISRYVEFANRYYTDKPIGLEVAYGSKKLGYGGTIDRIVQLDYKGKQNWLIDLKTSNSLHNSYFAQLAAYGKLWEQFNKQPIHKYGILHLKSSHRKEGDLQGKGWKLYDLDEWVAGMNAESWYDMFISAKKQWMLQYGSTSFSPRVFELNLVNKFYK
jgi:hypothetical protein